MRRSEAADAARRANAMRSTGPRTAGGKARSARNALRHGLSAGAVLLPGEGGAVFEAFAARLRADLAPSSPAEERSCRRVILAAWRLSRAEGAEAAAGSGAAAIEAADRLGRHEAALERAFYRELGAYRGRRRDRG